MDEQLRQDIMQNYGSECWEPITGRLYPAADESFQLFKFERDVEHDGKTYRCIIIEKCVYDGHSDDVDYTEYVFNEAWEL